MKRGQGAVLDALILMMICASAAALMLYVAELYGSNSNKQIMAVYNYEYANTALLSLRYVDDDAGSVFWETLKLKLGDDPDMAGDQVPVDEVQHYFQNDAKGVFQTLSDSASGLFAMKFKKEIPGGMSSSFYCYFDYDPVTSQDMVFCTRDLSASILSQRFTTYTVSTAIKSNIGDMWEVSIQIYF